ncbi:MAG: tetratricopeptide repeat protein [Planctomycetota bacterium]
MRGKIAELLAGRWQIPLALVAATAGSVTLFRLTPAADRAPLPEVLADVAVLEEAGDLVGAADAVANLLALDPPLPPAEQATLHERMADLLFRAEQSAAVHSAANLDNLLEHTQAAGALGVPPSAEDTFRAACAHQWLGHADAALRGFLAALDAGLPADDRRRTLAGLVTLVEQRPEAREERDALIAHLLADDTVAPPHLWWGLQRGVEDALDEENAPHARELIARHGERLKGSALKGYLEYLDALVSVGEGRPELAEPVVRWVDEWIAERGGTAPALDEFGDLRSLNRCLAGRTALALERFEDALAAFERTLEYRPESAVAGAAQVGRAEALAKLDRHDAALAACRAACEPGHAGSARLLEKLHAFLLRWFERQRAVGDHEHALGYLALAAGEPFALDPAQRNALVEQLGRTYTIAAQAGGDSGQRRRYQEQAGINLEKAAAGAAYDDARLAELLWSAAEAFDRCGRIDDVRRVLERFVASRSEHSRLPAALLQLGRACDALGDLPAALRWYGRVSAEYPGLEQAVRARVLSARLRMSLSAEHHPAAEAELAEVLSGDVLGPDAEAYHDALLTLCELLQYDGRYAEAIGRLEQFQQLYPDDPGRLRAGLMTAEAYRRSATVLCQDGRSAAAAEARQRFIRAADLYAALLNELDAAEPSDLARLYTRLALFYQADCLFELNEPDTLNAALAIYRSAAARYEGQPAALNAHVQIANTLLRLGDTGAASHAIVAARWMLRGMRPGGVPGFAADDRAAWEQYLTVVGDSTLLQPELTCAP